MYWFLWIFVGFVAGWLRAGASKEKAMADSWTSRWGSVAQSLVDF